MEPCRIPPFTALLIHFAALFVAILGIGSLALILVWAGRLML